jgi:hypothetical protein
MLAAKAMADQIARIDADLRQLEDESAGWRLLQGR